MTGLSKNDRRFGHVSLSRLDFKQVEMDRVLTGFLARLRHRGLPSRLMRGHDLTVDSFADYLIDPENGEFFEGFDEETARRWAQTHLLDLVNRGKGTEAVAGPRPLHGFTYHYRNARRSRPYGADEQLYEMLRHSSTGLGRHTLEALTEFFFPGVDQVTWSADAGVEVDVETQALINLTAAKRPEDIADTGRAPEPHPPLLPWHGDLLAEDVLRLLRHRSLMPRTVIIDALKTLFAFHLARYHIELIELLPALLTNASAGRARPGRAEPALLVDITEQGVGMPMARLSGRSAAAIQSRIPVFIRAVFAVRALADFAEYQVRNREIARPSIGFFPVDQLLNLAGPAHASQRENYFRYRIEGIVKATDEALLSKLDAILDLQLEAFDAYLELVMYFRGDFHRRYLVQCLDTLLLKSRPGALIAQPHLGDRRFVLDNHLLEVLVQLIVLRPHEDGTHRTTSMRVDELLADLRCRYGLYIDYLPVGLLDAEPTPSHRSALRANNTAFLHKLREIGYYKERSDAYLTQTVTPRYQVGVDREHVR